MPIYYPQQYPLYLLEMMFTITIILDSRVSSLLHVPVGHTKLIYKTFRFSAINIWNYVKANVSTNSFYTSFKNAIKCHLLGNNVNNLFKSVKFSHR